jgi:hypothetical protein
MSFLGFASGAIGSGKRRSVNQSQTGIATCALQLRLPNAKVLYASATGASEVAHLAFMVRLGLYGPGTRFPNFFQFFQLTKNGGIAVAELLACELRLAGRYVARALSYEGCEFNISSLSLTPAQVLQYDRVAQFFLQLLCIKRDSPLGLGKGGTTVWACHQRVFKGLLVAFKCDTAVALVEQMLAEGYAPVISLWSTAEARTAARIADDSSLAFDQEEVVAAPKLQLEHLVQSCESLAPDVRQKLLDEIADMELPENPLDYLIDKLVRCMGLDTFDGLFCYSS